MIKHYETSLYGSLRHALVDRKTKTTSGKITINDDRAYQSILGFGGAFTEAATYTLNKLSKTNQEMVLKAYFDITSGLGYNLGRVHINSCDFALENYSYVEDYDTELKTFDIAREKKWVIPTIKAAEKIRGQALDLLASPWSPPAWMKSNNEMNHGGKLRPEYYQSWADYYIRFIEAFKAEDLNIFAISVQNEPAAVQTWDSCEYSAEEERDFIKDYLGPTLKSSPFKDVGIVIWDHNRDIVVERVKTTLGDVQAKAYIWGTGIHWYVSEAFENLTTVHNLYPDKHILFTEGCIEGGVKLGAFDSAERYARNMIGDFNNYCEGYIDWNLLLNEFGGPNHVGNFCDAPIIADTQNDIIHFNSSYYAIGHFSKHIQVGARRIGTNTKNTKLNHVAFLNPDNSKVIVIQNDSETDQTVELTDTNITYPCIIKKRSIVTITIEV